VCAEKKTIQNHRDPAWFYDAKDLEALSMRSPFAEGPKESDKYM